MKDKTVEMAFYQKFPLIECSCGAKFILIHCSKGFDEWSYEETTTFLNQEDCYYCPYCGKKKEKL